MKMKKMDYDDGESDEVNDDLCSVLRYLYLINFVANKKNCFLLKILSRKPSFRLYSILYVGELASASCHKHGQRKNSDST